ncbi:hypothetical protein [Fibrobacter sp. UWR4]|uniref:hypothetical protein n=2 Tax=unclassified Fibrobacter TaxID=2634177 RepID=UPI0011B29155|nr:hypothetical protein [Fibrobacter sp. UWR4]
MKEYTMQNMGHVYVTSRTIHIPAPLPLKFEFGGAWSYHIDMFSLEKELFAFTVIKNDTQIGIRGARKDYFSQDTTFTSPLDVSDEEFAMYYLNWDMDYWKKLVAKAAEEHGHEINYKAGEAVYNTQKKYGTISRSLPDSKTCTLASVQAGKYIYMITGTTSIDDTDDICEVIEEIWNDRAEF